MEARTTTQSRAKGMEFKKKKNEKMTTFLDFGREMKSSRRMDCTNRARDLGRQKKNDKTWPEKKYIYIYNLNNFIEYYVK